jgi:hypothetical protein
MPITPTTAIPRRDLAGHIREHRGGLDRFIGAKILPFYPADVEASRFARIPASAPTQMPNIRAATRSGFQVADWELENDNYQCEKYGIDVPVYDDDRRRYAEQIDCDSEAAELAQRILLTNMESRVAALIQNTTTWPQSGDTGLAVTNEWDDTTNCIPAADVAVGKDAIFRQTGAIDEDLGLQVSYYTAQQLMLGADFRAAMKIDSQPMGAGINTALLRAYFGVGEVVVGMEQYNAADTGQTESLTALWNREYASLYVRSDGSSRLSGAQIGRTFAWNNGGQPWEVSQIREDKLERDLFRAKHWVDEKVFGARFGFLFSNITT